MDMELIMATSRNGIIGKEGKLPWKLKEDLNHFRDLTLFHIVVMGRKTFESLPNGPLEKRINVVITSRPELYETTKTQNYPNTEIYFCRLNESDELIENLWSSTLKRVFIIGGTSIYNYFFSKTNILHITWIDEDVIGDVKSPIDITKLHKKEFILVETEHHVQPVTGMKYDFLKYVR